MNGSIEHSLSFLDQILGYSDTLAIIALIFTVAVFIHQQRNANRIERQENYLTLELGSNDLFKFEGEHASALAPFQAEKSAERLSESADAGLADAFYFMTLNLFEISIRFRKNKTIDKDVFGSWVVWYYDTLCAAYFREHWPDLRENYTPDLRQIFDGPVRRYDSYSAEQDRKLAFFAHVGKTLKCPIVQDWLKEPPLPKPKPSPAKPAISPTKTLSQWHVIKEEQANELSKFFNNNISGDANYISHSEYFEGLSPDGKTWKSDLTSALREGLLSPRSSGVYEALMLRQDGVLCAAALVHWDTNGTEHYGVIEDMSVAKPSRRQGLAAQMIEQIKSRAADKSCAALWLESGKDNHGAHALFKKEGFTPFSKTYQLRLNQNSSVLIR